MQKKKLKQNYIILAIDTSCDETSVAITRDDKVVANIISSQVSLHRKWGGVVPDIAKRAHQEKIDQSVSEALKRAKVDIKDVDAVAVTQGPGLAIALEVGIKKAKEISLNYQKPLIAVNHMEGHLFSSLVKNSKGKGSKMSNLSRHQAGVKGKMSNVLGLLVSGGHTELVLIEKLGQYKKIGWTVDDAAGEAFDKFAKMLDLGYPGGHVVEEFAKKCSESKYELPRPMKSSGDLNYSFSGLKTAALYLIRDLKKELKVEYLPKQIVYDLCLSFQEAVIDSLMIKFEKAIVKHSPRMAFCGGGVLANVNLRRSIRKICRRYNITALFPYNERLYTDNAAMIGVAAFFKAQRGEFWEKSFDELDRLPGLSL